MHKNSVNSIPRSPHSKNSGLKMVAVVIVMLAVLLPLGCIIIMKQHDKQEQKELEEVERLNRQKEKQAREQEIMEARQRYKADQEKAYCDWVEYINRPTYTEEEVEEMLRAKVPSYSEIDLWKRDNDNWIMKYEKVIRRRPHDYLRCFNPTDNTFGKEIEVKCSTEESYRGNKTEILKPLKGKGRFEIHTSYNHNTIYFFSDAKATTTTTRWDADGIKKPHLCGKTMRPRTIYDKDDEGWDYEDAEDEYNDYDEDLYLFYGR